MKYVPNALTIGRIVITPVMLAMLLSEILLWQIVAFVLFVAAAISDYLDGRLARTLKARSRLGHFLDPFADKILVLGTFVALIFMLPHVVPWWAVALIALRDVAVTAMRSWAARRGMPLRTLPVAKGKTVVQLAYLIVVLLLIVMAKLPGSLGREAGWLLSSQILYYALLVVVVVTLATGVIYFARQDFSGKEQTHG